MDAIVLYIFKCTFVEEIGLFGHQMANYPGFAVLIYK